jgi:hypothetical protein
VKIARIAVHYQTNDPRVAQKLNSNRSPETAVTLTWSDQ